ncbi:30S ribosomal protein S1 [Ignatzschineria ureiclastica]|uniref:Small ribosomal subunit protein bS1 n=1 Tax=Ignatzschineria ureiclastica TaxID=472582 RepID=A0A2U2AFD6_9GAMM|nr:30S ribosomal protein S1 [Ignatzschineria ureiclastica]PWD81289.1 30S ribosomal protein S1 [Ignatzschineria ureiclastica]GGZ97792.1 30S ribosomal protein S1 [Ignatzschineria ureiclastica]
MSLSFADLFEQSIAEEQAREIGGIIKATVVKIENGFVIVDAGLKSEGRIPAEQFQDLNGELEVQVGDKVDVVLESLEDGFGETRLSREKAKRAEVWAFLEKKLENDEIIKGVISGRVKGGFTVDIGTERAFLPGSLVDVRPVRDIAYLEGKELELKVIKLDQKRNNIVVSRRAVLEEEYSAEREELLKNLEEGDVVKGVVKNLTDYGAFIDLGGIDGLLHITDMAWKRVRHPSEIVEINQEIEVKLLKFDKERNRVSLGLKQLGEDPWKDIAMRFPAGLQTKGKVTNITDYGCFVEIEPGIEGLVHVSEMDWTNKNVNPSKVVTAGEEVGVVVLDIDEERRRISLGMKQCMPNPWEEFAVKYNKNDKIKGTIKSITDFGIFIGLEGGIDGLVHLSDISWSVPGEEAIREYNRGDEIEAMVLAVDADRERISLGIKQLDQDPFSSFLAEHEKGSLVKGVVTEVDAKYAVVDLGDGVEGNLRASEISSERVEDVRNVYNVGDEVEARFVSVDRRNRSIVLSVKAVDEVSAQDIAEYANDQQVGATFGDLLKEQLKQQ